MVFLLAENSQEQNAEFCSDNLHACFQDGPLNVLALLTLLLLPPLGSWAALTFAEFEMEQTILCPPLPAL